MNRNTWIILGLVVLLGAVYFFTRQEKVSVGVKHLQLPEFKESNVDRIEISGKHQAVLVKNGDTWMLEIGEGDNKHLVDADKNHVSSMLGAALALKPSYYVTELSDKLKDLGLEPDTMVSVAIKSGEKIVWTLEFGNNTAHGGRYAKKPQSKDVYVVKAQFWQLIRNNAIDWRERTLLSINPIDLREFELKIEERSLHLEKKEEGEQWNFAADQSGLPSSYRADGAALTAIVRAAATLRASGFIDEKKMLGEPLASVSFKDKDGTSYSYKIYSAEKEKLLVVVDGKEQIFEIAKSSFDRVNRSINDVRDLSVINFNLNDIAKISLADKKSRVVLEKSENEWQLMEPKTLAQGFEFDKNSPETFLSEIVDLKAVGVADDKKDLPQNAQWQNIPLVEVSDKQGHSYALYAVRTKTKGEYLVKGTIDKLIYIVKEDKLEFLNKGVKAFKKIEAKLPVIDENVQGFEGLPPEIQRQLLNAAQQKR